MTYSAIVARIHTRPHPNADKLQLGTAAGYQVVVGLDTKDGELGVYFPCDGQLSEEFAKEHDLVGYTGTDGLHHGGFFAKNRRVRIQKLRGEKSEGFWVPLSYFLYTGVSTRLLTEGLEFTELNGNPICNQYVSPATSRAQAQQQGKQGRGETTMFKKHFDTEQLRHHIDEIPEDALIIITEKLHGTSHRVGNVLEKINFADMNWRSQIITLVGRALGNKGPSLVWREVHGSRNIILDTLEEDKFHGGNFRSAATASLKGQLHKGEVVYLEIVGYSDASTPIMNTQDTGKLKDKAFLKRYGPKMVYSYGCAPGQARPFVYRITQVNEDGYAVDLSWLQVKARCRELGVEHVPELDIEIMGQTIDTPESLKTMVDSLINGPSTLDLRHMREGVVVRVDHDKNPASYKAKSFEFLVLEDVLKEQDGTVDLEEAS